MTTPFPQAALIFATSSFFGYESQEILMDKEALSHFQDLLELALNQRNQPSIGDYADRCAKEYLKFSQPMGIARLVETTARRHLYGAPVTQNIGVVCGLRFWFSPGRKFVLVEKLASSDSNNFLGIAIVEVGLTSIMYKPITLSMPSSTHLLRITQLAVDDIGKSMELRSDSLK